MSVAEFAAALGVSRQSVFLWESGENVPGKDRVADWLRDEREWVRRLGLDVFGIEYAGIVSAVLEAI